MDFLKVPVVDHNWILNTPERNEILSEGPPKHANCNILGKGAYGTVFKATFRGQSVAVKVVKNRSGINRTENETHILGWKHRHIVRILKVESTNNFGIIIMEHFPGQSLQLVLDSMELPLVHRVLISLDILCALCYCHKHDLLHLDVKPLNILVAFGSTGSHEKNLRKTYDVRRSYICKLCDFGSSMRLKNQALKALNARGTVRYMSPEALRAEELTPASDIYSLGITMWQLKQRQTPYDMIKCNEVVAFQVVKNDLRPDSDLQSFMQNDSKAISPRTKSNSCRCHYFNTEITCLGRKKLQYELIEKKQSLIRRCSSAGFRKNLSISPRTRTGSASKVWCRNESKTVSRDLRKEFDFRDCELNTNDFSRSLPIVFKDFFNCSVELLQRKEMEFCSIFRSCWRTLPEKRPCSGDLHKKLWSLIK